MPLEEARIHPGPILHTMDHYVMDLRDPRSEAAVYFTVYSLAYMPEVGTGKMGFLRVRDASGETSVDIAFAEEREAGRRMQKRLQRIVATSDTSRGIGTDLESEPILASFERRPFAGGSAGYVVTTADMRIEGVWSGADEPMFVAAPRGSFHETRDITGTMVAFWAAQLTIDGVVAAGEPYADDWWFERLGRKFSSCHFSLGDTAMEPAGDWWDGSA